MLLKKYNIKNSVLFWNSIPLIGQVILAFYSLEGVLMLQTFLFIFSVVCLIEEDKQPIFLYCNYGTVILYGIGLIIFGFAKSIMWLMDNPVDKFNKWLDTEKVKKEEQKKLNFNQFKEKISN